MAKNTLNTSMPRGIREVPTHLDATTQAFLSDLRENIVALRQQQAPPTTPSNLVVTPVAFGNLVQWTRPLNSDFSEVLWNTTANLQTAQIVPISDAAQWVDHIGQVGVTRFYWVRAARNNGTRSLIFGPKSGTSLASNVGVNPPPPPPPYQGGNRGQGQIR